MSGKQAKILSDQQIRSLLALLPQPDTLAETD
jgi:hypothetical protein